MSTKTEDTVSTVAVELSEKRNAKDEKETSAKRVKGFHIGHAGGAYSLGLKGEYIHTPGDVFNGKPVFRKFWTSAAQSYSKPFASAIGRALFHIAESRIMCHLSHLCGN